MSLSKNTATGVSVCTLLLGWAPQLLWAANPSFGSWLNNQKSRVVPYQDLAIGPRIQTARLDATTDVRLDRQLGTLSILRHHKTIWKQNISPLRPWKLQTANVEGNGRRDIVLGVYKTNRFFPYLHPGVYIYYWANNNLVPVWRGSNLSEPFDDFSFVPMPAADVLAAVEIKSSGRRCLGVYRWQHFGFVRDQPIGDWHKAKIEAVNSGQVVVQADGHTLFIPIGGK